MRRRIRRAARVLVFDPGGHLLMFRFTPDDRPPLWATAGGEADPGESYEDAARRELREETGIEAEPGPVIAVRESDFTTFAGEPVHAIEQYFEVRVSNRHLDFAGHTDSEQAVMQHHQWLSLAELRALARTEMVYPEDLGEIVETLR